MFVDVRVELVPLQRRVGAEVAGVDRVTVRAPVAVVGIGPDAAVEEASGGGGPRSGGRLDHDALVADLAQPVQRRRCCSAVVRLVEIVFVVLDLDLSVFLFFSVSASFLALSIKPLR